MSDRLEVLLQHLLPKRRMTAFAGLVARSAGGAIDHAANPLVRGQVRRRHVGSRQPRYRQLQDLQ